LGVLGGRGAEGLMVGLAYGGIFSLAAWKTEGVLQPVDAIHFSYAWLRNGVGMAAAFALIATVVVGRGEGVAIGAFVGVFTGLAILLMGGLGEGLVENEIVAYSRPNQRTWLSARSAMRFVLFSGVVFATGIAPLQILFVGKSDNAIYRVLNGLWDGLAIGLFAGLFFGLLGGLWKGGLFFLQHFIVRVFLWYKGLAPLSYVRFLDYAAEHLFLRKVGGRYIFIHRLLLEYFASLENKPQ
jgi:hypothetical protein